MAAAAPFFREFDLPSRGVRLVHPEVCYAHPLDGGRAAVSRRSLEETADGLGADGAAYRRLFGPLVEHGRDVVDFFLTSQLRRPPTRSVPEVTKFALTGLPNVRWLARRYFDTEEAQALLAGAAAHGMLDLARPLTASLGMMLGMLAHHVGWPLIEGGSQKLADAMVAALEEQGGEVVTGHEVTDLREFDGVPAVLLDTTPRAFVAMAGDRVHEGYRRWVSRYKHGPGVFKVDWVLSEPVPWTNPDVRRVGDDPPRRHPRGDPRRRGRAGAGPVTDKPYVLAVQPTVVDPTRAPEGGHIFWAYVHVPHGSDVDMTEAIENQVERFAPGSATPSSSGSTKNAVQMEAVEPQPHRRRHLQRRGVVHPDAGPPGAAVEHLQDADPRDLPRLGGHPARARRCTASAATTPPGWRCARCSASGTPRRCGPPSADAWRSRSGP